MSKITKTLLVTAKEDLLKVIDKMDSLLGNIRNEIITNQQLIESNSVATKQELYIESEKIKKELDDYKVGNNRLKWMSASGTVTNTTTVSDEILTHLAYQGIDLALIVMVNINSKTDSVPVKMADSRVINAIVRAREFGVKVNMLKPHLGIDWSDGTERYNLTPSDMDTMMNKWKDIVVSYAGICNSYNIPVLCIGCEQREMTKPEYKHYWEDIVSECKGLYPDLLLTYACDSVEGVQYNTSCIFGLVDFIGLNLYPQWYKEVYKEGLTYKDIMPSAYSSYAPTGKGFKLIDRIKYLYTTYKKPIYITEIGVMPYADGLVNLKSEFAYDESAPRDYRVSAICYESIFNTLAKSPYVIGLSLWHTKHPFCYFDYTDASTGTSDAEEIVKQYVEGGDLVER